MLAYAYDSVCLDTIKGVVCPELYSSINQNLDS